MIREFRGLVIITVILISISGYQAAKKDIVNFDDGQFEVDNKTRAMANLLRKCLLNRGILLAVSENLSDELVNYLHRSETASITSLASSKLFVHESYFAASENKKLYYDNRYYRFLWKSHGFLVAAFSPANLKEQLDKLKASRWWNSAGLFFLIEDESNSLVPSCSNAEDFLSLAWKYSLLHTVFLCQAQDGTHSMYSFNPYGHSAPQPWLKYREVKSQHRHPWSLFKWENYDGLSHTCETIFFDKTTSLEGYPIRMNAFSLVPFLYFTPNKTGLRRYEGEDARVMKTIWNFLNASFIDVPLAEKDAAVGWVDDDGTFYGNLIAINSGKVDIGFNSMILQPLWKVTTTYPHSSVNLCFVTRDQGEIPWLIGLIMVFDKWTMICAALTFLLTMLLFGYVNGGRYFSGFMNTLRIFVSSSFLRPPSMNGLRIILFFVFLVPITFNSTIQGNIISLIRDPFHYANVESMEDLKATGSHVEGFELVKTFISVPEMQESFVSVKDFDTCFLNLYAKKPVACMNYCSSLVVKASHHKNIRLAEEQTPHYQNRYIASPDWPLINRFNALLQRIVESGLMDFFRARSFFDKFTVPIDDASDNTAIVLRLHDFRYAFIALGIGWSLAALVFIAELFIGRSKLPKVTKMRMKPFAGWLQGFKKSRLMSRIKLRFAGLCNDGNIE